MSRDAPPPPSARTQKDVRVSRRTNSICNEKELNRNTNPLCLCDLERREEQQEGKEEEGKKGRDGEGRKRGSRMGEQPRMRRGISRVEDREKTGERGRVNG